MSQNQKKTRTEQTKGNEPAKSKGKRKVNGKRVMGFIAALVILIGGVSLGVNLFGGVNLSSADVNTSTASSNASSGTTGDAAAATETTAAPTLVDGHYVQPANADWNLKLVNAWNPLDKNYAQSLVTYAGSNQFDSRAIDSLRALIAAGSQYNIRVASTYRTYDQQAGLYEKQVNQDMSYYGLNRQDAETKAATEVARPGTSEHNLGLATDLLFENYSNLVPAYENTAAYTWMMQHCADYGFILRFPKNKQDMTGVTFEPWHYRYVGQDAAHEIMSRGITLEEYLQEKGK